MSTKYEDLKAWVGAWYEEGKRLADALKKCEQTCEVHDMLDTISNGVDINGDKSRPVNPKSYQKAPKRALSVRQVGSCTEFMILLKTVISWKLREIITITWVGPE